MAVTTLDPRPAQVLACVGSGLSAEQAGSEVGISAKTISRWRAVDRGLPGYRAAYAAVKRLGRIGTDDARAEIDEIVAEWTPGGLIPEGWRCPTPPPKPTVYDPVPVDVISSSGQTLVVAGQPAGPSPYTDKRAPTPDEWCAMMAEVAMDRKQPERVRLGAQAAVTAMLAGGPVGRINRARAEQMVDEQVAEAARERGRDAGVPAAVWEQVRINVLGPQPGRARDDEDVEADIVELDQAAPG